MSLLAAASIGVIATVAALGLVGATARRSDPLMALVVLVIALEVDVEPLAGAAADRGRDLVVAAIVLVAAVLGWWSARRDRSFVFWTPLVYLLALPVLGLVLAPTSVDPVVSASKSLATIAVVVVVAVAVLHRGFDDVLEAAVLGLALIVLASVLSTSAGITGPSIDWAGQPDVGIGGLRRFGGIAGDPNALGRVSALCSVGGAALLYRGRGRVPILLEVIGIGGLVFAQSRTAIAAAVIALAFVHVRHGHKRAVAALISLGMATVILITVSSRSLVDAVTRDGGGVGELATGTGRTTLWRVVWTLAWERPIVGHGAFASKPVLEAAVAARWVPFEAPDAHNLLLNLFLTQGLLAVAIVAALVGSISGARDRFQRGVDPRIVTLGIFVLLSITENTLRKPGAALVVLSAAVASLTFAPRPAAPLATPSPSPARTAG
ncbi:MAG: O-antigen ligase family protein [Acidimicrobiales bacterium]